MSDSPLIAQNAPALAPLVNSHDADQVELELKGLFLGEILPSFTMLTVNCNDHPMLSRLHKPERDPVTKEVLPLAKQDKRSLVHIDAENWDAWLCGPAGEARVLLVPRPAEVFDQADVLATDELLSVAEPQTPIQQDLI